MFNTDKDKMQENESSVIDVLMNVNFINLERPGSLLFDDFALLTGCALQVTIALIGLSIRSLHLQTEGKNRASRVVHLSIQYSDHHCLTVAATYASLIFC